MVDQFEIDQYRNKFNILIVDDEEDIREVLTMLVESEGYNFFEASSGIEALQHFEKNEIHLVLSDYRMPGMNGIELSEKMLDKNYEIPIVIISGAAEREIIVNALRTGITDIIDKPFNNDQIKKTIRKYFSHFVSDTILKQSEKAFIWEFFEEEVSKDFTFFEPMIERLKKSPLDSLVCDLLIDKFFTLKNKSMEVDGAEVLFGVCHTLERLFTIHKEVKKPLKAQEAALLTETRIIITLWTKALAKNNITEINNMTEKMKGMLKKLGDIEIDA